MSITNFIYNWKEKSKTLHGRTTIIGWLATALQVTTLSVFGLWTTPIENYITNRVAEATMQGDNPFAIQKKDIRLALKNKSLIGVEIIPTLMLTGAILQLITMTILLKSFKRKDTKWKRAFIHSNTIGTCLEIPWMGPILAITYWIWIKKSPKPPN